MASWNIPALADKISSDIHTLKELFSALLKWTNTNTTDIPAGAKRIQSVTGGVQIQKYSNSEWTSIGKLMHGVDTLDGKHATATATANSIPVRDSNGAVPGDVTGAAETTTEASSLASGYIVPMAKGGTGAGTAEDARTSLGANNASNISDGILATTFGGTGRTDGRVTDIYLSEYNIGAVAAGEVGPASQKTGVDADSLIVPGFYLCTGCTSGLNYPTTEDCFVHVESSGEVGNTIYLIQRVVVPSIGKEYSRKSVDGGASWGSWASSGSTASGDVDVYISKGGNDANSGLSSSSPVLTLSRFLLVLASTKTTGDFICHFGPGEWGDLAVDGGLLQTKCVKITNYTNTDVPTTPIVAEGETIPEGTYFEGLTVDDNFGNQPPHFDSIAMSNVSGRFGNISVNTVSLSNVSFSSDGAFSFCSLNALKSYVKLIDHIIRKETGVTSPVFLLDDAHLEVCCASSLCKVLEEPTNAQFLKCRNRCSVHLTSTVDWHGVFSGQKFVFDSPVLLYGDTTLDILPGTTGDGTWFSKREVHIQDGVDTLADVSVKSETASGVTSAAALIKVGNSNAPLVNGAVDSATLSVVHKSDGTKYATVSTPPSGDKTNKIANTRWASSNSFSVGTRMLFQQSAAPSGWTKETNSGYNDTALRLITGDIANKTNGKAFTTCMVASRYTNKTTQGGSISNTKAGGTVGNKALSVAMLASHSHQKECATDPGSNNYLVNSKGVTVNVTSSSSGSGSNHNHGFTATDHTHSFTGVAHDHYLHLNVNYIDCIVAAKA